MKKILIAALLLLLTLTGCGDSSHGDPSVTTYDQAMAQQAAGGGNGGSGAGIGINPNGFAISNLTYLKNIIVSDRTFIFSYSFDYTSNAALSSILYTDSNGLNIADSQVFVTDSRSGTMTVISPFIPSTPGVYTFTVRISDSDGRISNTLTGNITISNPPPL